MMVDADSQHPATSIKRFSVSITSDYCKFHERINFFMDPLDAIGSIGI